MAIIQPSGNFPNQPVTGGSKSREAKQPEQVLGFPAADGLTLSGAQLPPGVPTPGPLLLPGPLKETPPPLELPTLERPNATVTYDPLTGTMNYFMPNWQGGPSSDILAHERVSSEFGGALLSGPGVASGIAALQDIGGTGGVSEFTFTNGLHSTQLVGINGKVLADLSPFK